jgi:hypothetical protein
VTVGCNHIARAVDLGPNGVVLRETVSRLLPDSFSGGLNCLLNTCDCSMSVVGSGWSPPASINSLLAPLFTSLIFRSSVAFFSLSILLQPIMGKGRRGRGLPHRVGDKRKCIPSPPLEDFGDSEYSKEVSSGFEGSPTPLLLLHRSMTRTTPRGWPLKSGRTYVSSSALGSKDRMSRRSPRMRRTPSACMRSRAATTVMTRMTAVATTAVEVAAAVAATTAARAVVKVTVATVAARAMVATTAAKAAVATATTAARAAIRPVA